MMEMAGPKWRREPVTKSNQNLFELEGEGMQIQEWQVQAETQLKKTNGKNLQVDFGKRPRGA